MNRLTPLVLACLLVSACTDSLSGPSRVVTSTLHPLTTQDEGCPPEVIICDGEPTVTYGTYIDDVGDISGTGEETYSMTAAEAAPYIGMPNGSTIACPYAIPWVGSATFFPPGEPPIEIFPTGLVQTLVTLGPNAARYRFPRNQMDADWMWPEIGPGGRYAVAMSADGVCSLRTNPHRIVVSFHTFNGVRVRYPTRQSSYGGGGGGGLPNCHLEYVYLEINYGDGTGWHVIWQGYATVCG